jgi:hypothetical protein
MIAGDRMAIYVLIGLAVLCLVIVFWAVGAF